MPAPFESKVVEAVEAIGQKHRTGVFALVFTDMVGSTALKQKLGDRASASLFGRHHQLVRETLAGFPEGEEIETAGDSFLLVFSTPSEAVRFALLLQAKLRNLRQEVQADVADRLGIHLGEVVLGADARSRKPRDVYGIQIDTCARVMSLAQAGQILMTRAVFDSARQVLKGEDIEGLGPIEWLNHGPYLLKGLEETVEICEVREAGQGPGEPPASSEKAQRQARADEEHVLGWRPAVGQLVPNTKWVLEQKLGEGGFGEVWLGCQRTTKERRVFKFCFQAERVRFLKRELTLFRLLKERVGDHPNIVRLHDIYLDQAPFYVEMDYVEGRDLKAWCEAHGGLDQVSLETRLEIVAQVGDALQAAHDAGVIHRDVKPANILVERRSRREEALTSPIAKPQSQIEKRLEPPHVGAYEVSVKLTDFGIGQVVSEEFLKGITRAGFTQTIMSDSSSSHTGTQIYMAPELLAGKPASTRSDIYSLGVVLYQLLARDFSRPVTTDWAKWVADPLLKADLEQCFAGDPEDRFAGASQLAKQLRGLAERRAEWERNQAVLAARERAAYRRGIIRTASLAAVIVTFVLALALIAWNQSRKAQAAQAKETQLRAEAQAQELAARRRAYAADMNLVQQALTANDLHRARYLLDRQRPKGAEKDLRGWEWRYLWQNCRGDALYKLCQQSVRVFYAGFSSDGKVATLDDAARVSLWDTTTKAELSRLQDQALNAGLLPNPGQACISDDGEWIAAVALDKAAKIVRVWKIATREVLAVLPIGRPATTSIAISPDKKLVAVFAVGDGVSLWDMTTIQRQKLFPIAPDQRGWGGALRFSPDGLILAIGDEDGRVRLVDIKTFTETVSFAAAAIINRGVGVISLAFSPDGRVLAVGTAFTESQITLWDVRAKAKLGTLEGHRGFVASLAFSPDGKTLASASGDQTIKLWNTSTWKEETTLIGHVDEVWSVSFSRDGRMLVSSGKDGSVYVWPAGIVRLNRGHLSLPIGTETYGVSPDGKNILTINNDGAASLWDVTTGQKQAAPARLGTNNVAAFWSSPDEILIGARDPARIKVWNRADGTVTEYPLNPDQSRPFFWFLPQSKAILTAHTNSGTTSWTFKRWDTRSRREVSVFTVNKDLRIWDATFSSNERLLAINTSQRWVTVLNLATGHEEYSFTAHRFTIQGMAVFPDRKLLATATTEAPVVKVWNLATRQEVVALRGHNLVLNGIVVSPDGERLATSTIGQEPIKLWDTTSWEETANLEVHGASVGLDQFLPDGNTLVADDVSGRVHLWRAPSWAEIGAAEAKEKTQTQRP